MKMGAAEIASVNDQAAGWGILSKMGSLVVEDLQLAIVIHEFRINQKLD
jgi:hypothetical protein